MGLIYDIASALMKSGNETINNDKISDSLRMQGKMNAITKMAKSSIFSYPVLLSEGIVGSDEDLTYALCSYLETQYAVWTLISMGLNPVYDGTDPKSHIAKFYSEEYEALALNADFNGKVNASVKLDTKSKFKISEENLKEYKFSTEGAESGNTSTIKEPVMVERNVVTRTVALDPKTNKPIIDKKGNQVYNEHPVLDANGLPLKETVQAIGKDGKPMFNEIQDVGISAKLTKLETKVRQSDPTIINVKLKMAENQHTVEFPIAVKAMPRFISSKESETIFTYLRDDKPLVRVIKLLSGEIGLFKDIIFQLERAKKDKELYSKLGRHPWFRVMMERRTGRRINGLAQLIPGLSSLVNGKSDVLPICSLCVTKDEIESGFSNLWANIKKSDENIMDKLMLLCLCVVDTTTNVVEFDFYGLKNNTIIRAETLIKENKGGGDDKGKDMEKLIQSLIYKV